MIHILHILLEVSTKCCELADSASHLLQHVDTGDIVKHANALRTAVATALEKARHAAP